jgi:hypothetical protein
MQQQAEKKDYAWLLLLGFFLLVAAAFIARAMLNAGTTPLIADTDDAMRLVTVRDLLGGQGWFDNVQHRMNTPYGAELHWSRLVDLPIAALFLLLQPFAGTGTTTLVVFIWPLLLLLALLLLSVMVSGQLVSREGRLAALALPALSLVTMAEFVPGRIDHHSIQILLMLGLLLCAIRALQRPRYAIGAGVIAATAMAIGTESIPIVAAAIACFGLMWVLRPERADAMRWFGLSFAIAALSHLALSLPPDRWFAPACDAISIVYIAAALGVGLVFTILSLLPLGARHPLLRLVPLTLGGGLTLLGIALAFPDCMRGPYGGLDPWLMANWIDNVTEAEPVWRRFFASPGYTLGVTVPPLLALGVTGWRLWRGPATGRGGWLIYGLFLAFAIVVMLVQIRACRFATTLAVPAGAWLIVEARRRYLATRSPLSIAALLGSWLGFAGLAIGVGTMAALAMLPGKPASDTVVAESKAACLMPQAFADLSAMPPERVMTPIDLGSHMLAFTPHSVVAAPYHRNEEGVRDAFAFFSDPIAKARLILDIRGVTLVVICPGMPEVRGRPDAAPDSFAKLFAAGNLPDWLVDHSVPGAALKVYSVQR